MHKKDSLEIQTISHGFCYLVCIFNLATNLIMDGVWIALQGYILCNIIWLRGRGALLETRWLHAGERNEKIRHCKERKGKDKENYRMNWAITRLKNASFGVCGGENILSPF